MTYEDILKNPELLDEVERRARHERRVAIGALFARLLTAIKAIRHAPRPHLAH